MDRTSASPPVQTIQNVPESELRNRFARTEHHVDVPGAAEARAEEGKAQEQLAEAKILSHSEQVAAQERGLKPGTIAIALAEGVPESQAGDRKLHNYLEQRRQQGRASQQQHARRTLPPVPLRLRPLPRGWVTAASVVLMAGTSVGVVMGGALAIMGFPYPIVIPIAMGVPGLGITFALIYARRGNT